MKKCRWIWESIQTIVENAIKYQMVVGEILSIQVACARKSNGYDEHLHLCMWDSGDGFEINILENMEKRNIPMRDGDGMELYSLSTQRRLLHGERTCISFSNRPGADLHN